MQNHQDIHFVIVGDGYLKEFFKTQNLDLKNITFAPSVQKASVQSILLHADILYFAVHKSSLLKFGQSLNKLIDYMMAGKPIVASYSGYPSMINESGCGSYVPAEDPASLVNEIKRYFSMSAEQRNSIGVKGRAWLLENRSYKKLASEYISILFDKENEC
jgi:glycosyltransferase involved in cell wall biosynthesis